MPTSSTPGKYGVWAVRYATSVFGAAEAWAKEGGVSLIFDTLEEAEAKAKAMNAATTTPNVRYFAKERW